MILADEINSQQRLYKLQKIRTSWKVDERYIMTMITTACTSRSLYEKFITYNGLHVGLNRIALPSVLSLQTYGVTVLVILELKSLHFWKVLQDCGIFFG